MLLHPHSSGGLYVLSAELGAELGLRAEAKGTRMFCLGSRSQRTVGPAAARAGISDWFSLMPKSVFFFLLCRAAGEQRAKSRGRGRVWERSKL